MLRKPFILVGDKGWLIYDYAKVGSRFRRDGDGNPLAFPSRDAARRFLGLAPGRRVIEDSSCSEDIVGEVSHGESR